MKKIVTLLFIIYIFLSCSTKQPYINIPTIKLDFKNEVELSNAKTTEYFKNRKLIKLETTNESLISEISRLIIFDQKLFIFDHQTKTVFIFNEYGKYISKINHIGKGPGEYIQLTDFTIDEKNKQIILLCDIPNCLIYLDLKGKYIRSEKNKKYYRYISKSENSVFLVSLLDKYDGNYISIKRGNKFNDFLPIENYINNKDFYSPHPNVIRSNNIYFFKVYDDLVYELSDDIVRPRYKINFGNKTVDKGLIESNDLNKILTKCSEQNLICRINDFRECDGFITFGTWPFNKIVIYNKNNKICKLFSGFYDPETGLYLHNIIAHDGPGDELAFEIQASSFINNVLSIKNINKVENNETYKRFKDVANNLKETDNPILMFYTLK